MARWCQLRRRNRGYVEVEVQLVRQASVLHRVEGPLQLVEGAASDSGPFDSAIRTSAEFQWSRQGKVDFRGGAPCPQYSEALCHSHRQV